MIAKEEIHKKQNLPSRHQKGRLGTNILLGGFILITISGFVLLYIQFFSAEKVLNIPLWWWAFIHRISALVSLVFTILYIVKHRKWYKKLSSVKSKSKITTLLSISFFITLLITFAWSMKKDSVPLEIIHVVMGIIVLVCIVIHSLKRYGITR